MRGALVGVVAVAGLQRQEPEGRATTETLTYDAEGPLRTLKDLLVKAKQDLEGDLANDKVVYTKFACECTNDVRDTGKAIEVNKQEITRLVSEMGTFSSEIAFNQDEVKDATKKINEAVTQIQLCTRT